MSYDNLKEGKLLSPTFTYVVFLGLFIKYSLGYVLAFIGIYIPK